MSIGIVDFLEKFKDEDIKSAEIKILSSPYYYIVQKNKGKTDLFLDREAEYLEEPITEKQKEILIVPSPLGGTGDFGSIKGLFSITKHEYKKEVELIKHLKDIKDIVKHINFEEVSEVIYEKD